MPADDPLSAYRARRNFALTAEPAEGGMHGTGALTFVVQKHWASRLHYDLRLALDGSLKSWALPKGPSLDAKVKRMAVQVEDHPLAYASFEGTIAPHQYGAGKVIIWDRGTWHPRGDPLQAYRDGHLKFELRGHKLRGGWVLLRLHGKNERQPPWLLIKEKDEYARATSEYSVVDALPDSVALSAQPASDAAVLPPGTPVADLPDRLDPQLATLVDGPPLRSQDWICEIKFDGYRLLTRIEGTDIRMFTRNGHDWSAMLQPLRQRMAAMKLPSGWYDGEMVLPDADGVPDFGALQQLLESRASGAGVFRRAPVRAPQRAADLVLYLFDLPYFNGHDLRALALETRRTVLLCLLEQRSSESIRFSAGFDGTLPDMLASACRLGLEGVIAKRRGSPYRSQRNTDWIKLKCRQRQEFVIGGYTDPRGQRQGVGALLLGVHDGAGALQYCGKAGSGVGRLAMQALLPALAPLVTRTNPFTNSATVEGVAHWVKPTLVAEVSFANWTRAGRIRHAVFHGLRRDKEASMIVREISHSATALAEPDDAAGTSKARSAAKPATALPRGMRVTHPTRVIDASSGITKIELLRYYAMVGKLMMLHLKDRPVSLLRAPDGVDGELFFQKHAQSRAMPGMAQLAPGLDRGHAPMLTVASARGLLSAAQWNVVEFHTQNMRAQTFEQPDRMVFDLDPGAGVAWPQVQQAAQLVHAFLRQLGLNAFLKTSGGKGLHVVVPLRKQRDSASVKTLSQAIVSHMARTLPQRFVSRSGPKNRIGKIFIDALRNAPGATTVCAWSARARPGLGISVPVHWHELDLLKGGDHWTVRTADRRLDQGNDAWRGYGQAARGLSTAMKLLEQ
jgi:bifunctional non-homologous end joining protein LigD